MLLSGNGRHRRPRPTPKLVIAAGVTGAGVAIPLLSAVSANAAPPSTWDKVATCESGNNWSINTGNGFYGGLQISQHTWDSYGGRIFAERPDLASRAEQIALADKVLAAEGPGAWATCGEQAGLTQGGLLDRVLPGDNSTDDGTADSNDGNSGDDQGGDNAQESPSPEVVAPGRGLDGSGQNEDEQDKGSSEATPQPSGSSTRPSQSAQPEQPTQPSQDFPVEAPAREFPPQPADGQDSGTQTPGKHAGAAKDESGDEDASDGQGKHRAPAKDDDGDVVGDTLDTVVPGQRLWNN